MARILLILSLCFVFITNDASAKITGTFAAKAVERFVNSRALTSELTSTQKDKLISTLVNDLINKSGIKNSKGAKEEINRYLANHSSVKKIEERILSSRAAAASITVPMAAVKDDAPRKTSASAEPDLGAGVGSGDDERASAPSSLDRTIEERFNTAYRKFTTEIYIGITHDYTSPTEKEKAVEDILRVALQQMTVMVEKVSETNSIVTKLRSDGIRGSHDIAEAALKRMQDKLAEVQARYEAKDSIIKTAIYNTMTVPRTIANDLKSEGSGARNLVIDGIPFKYRARVEGFEDGGNRATLEITEHGPGAADISQMTCSRKVANAFCGGKRYVYAVPNINRAVSDRRLGGSVSELAIGTELILPDFKNVGISMKVDANAGTPYNWRIVVDDPEPAA